MSAAKSTAPQAADPITLRELLRDRSFALYLAGQTTSGAGSALASIALVFAVLSISDSPGSVGLVLLAYAPAPVQEQVCAAPLARFTAHTITDPARLRATLAEVRRADAAVSDRQITADAVSVAAPIRDASGTVVAALSLVVPATAHPAVVVPAVRMAALGASRALGYPGSGAQRARGPFHSVEGPLAAGG